MLTFVPFNPGGACLPKDAIFSTTPVECSPPHRTPLADPTVLLTRRFNNLATRASNNSRFTLSRDTRRASQGGGPSTWTIGEKGVPTPFHSQHIAHRGACGKTRVLPQNRRPRPECTEMGVAKCVCCC